jgi:hypothetical protein
MLLVILLAAAWLSPANAAPRRVIIFVWDGMRPDAITEEDTPHLLELKNRGTWFESQHAVYPPLTMANAAAFAASSTSGPLGFYANRAWEARETGMNTPPGARTASGDSVSFRNPVFKEEDLVLRAIARARNGDLLKLSTLFEAAHKKGLRTAVVGKLGPAFLQDFRVPNEGDPDTVGLLLDEKVVLPLSFASELQRAGYHLPRTAPNVYTGRLTLHEGDDDPTGRPKAIMLNDSTTADASATGETPPTAANAWMMNVYLNEVLPRHRPDLSVVWMRNPDTTEHIYGVGSPMFHRALQAQDAMLDSLVLKLEALKMLASTDIIIVSDHGHSNIAGSRDLFPLRQIKDGRVAGVDNDSGYSVSGGIRMAHELTTRAGIPSFDGLGCVYSPVMSGIRADGSQVMPTRYDDGHCGRPGPYTTPSYVVPLPLPKGALVLAPNGGTEYLYQPERDVNVVKRAVRFLQSRDYVAAVFVDRRYRNLPGTLPADTVGLGDSSHGPDIIVSYAWDDAAIRGFRGTEYSTVFPDVERGEHGSFSPFDIHNTMVAVGPSFRAGPDSLPTGNVDVAPTVAVLLDLELPQAQGRVLREALAGGLGAARESYRVEAMELRPPRAAGGLTTQRIDGTVIAPRRFSFVVQLKQLTSPDGRKWRYFDLARPIRE